MLLVNGGIMTRSSTGFGTRQGGLAQPYRPGLESQTQINSARPSPQFMAPNSAAQPWGKSPKVSISDGSPSLSGLKHPVFMRWVSGAIDLFILMILTFLTMFAFDVLDGGLNGGGDVVILENGTLTLIIAALWFGYGLLFESSTWQGTPGKKLTGLVITDMSGQRIGFGRSFGRACGKVFSTFIPLYIPYIMVGATARKQSLHDKMCGTLVFRRHDLNKSNMVFD